MSLIKDMLEEEFTWGKVIKVHAIGDFNIIEYHPHIYKNNAGTNKMNYKKKEYQIWVKGRNCNSFYHSLDEALLGCLEQKYDGINSQFTQFAARMLKIKGWDK